ncbi:AtuA-related protein [Verminephrobacter eiseniae]|uniref:AtuA-related protein n=1 Tax=Verminephrobacter eiseniae TaxID=364317 RepID=UPI002237E1D9|nr:hypothetical protein [Verminephrobacter eiseniae]MCW5236905.1 hypothetical protein [Verminephrobacter eiseniae]
MLVARCGAIAIRVIARRPEYLPQLPAQLAPERLRTYLAHPAQGQVERFEAPGLHALDFVLRGALGAAEFAACARTRRASPSPRC